MMLFIRISFLLLGLGLAVHARAGVSSANDDAAVIEYLKGLDFAELQDVEVRLDDVFDIFDGLINRREVSVASGVGQSTARAPAVTSVITAQDIEAGGANRLDEVLQAVPGLHVARDNLYNPVYSIRGLYSLTNPEVLVLINGMPIKDLAAGNRGTAWGGMPVHNIARIEVIRGPGSAVYGADAFSGVINIITKKREDINGTQTGARVGSFDTYDGWLLHGGKWGGVGVAAAVQWHQTGGHTETINADRQSQLDRQTGTSASYAPGPPELGNHSLDANLDLDRGHWRARAGYQGRYDLGMGAGGAQALDPIGKLQDDRYNADLIYHNPTLTRYWDVTVQANYQDRSFSTDDVHLFPSGTRQPFPNQPNGVVYADGVRQSHNFSLRYLTLELDSFYTGFSGHVLRSGAGYVHQHLYDSSFITNRGLGADGKPIPANAGMVDLSGTAAEPVPHEKRKNAHAFVQDTWAFADRWELTAGVRYDDYSDFGATLNPRLALVWQMQPRLTAKLLYGQAFRAPSFRELYVYNNVYRGNRDLKAETIQTWELAFDYQAGEALNFTANLFQYQVDDKIRFAPRTGTTVLFAENSGIQEGLGGEFEARWKMSARSSLLFNYAYARNREADRDVGNYPHHTVYLRSDWLLKPNWYLDGQLNWVADRERPAEYAPGSATVDDAISVDLTLRYKNSKSPWNLAFAVRNVFDSDIREPLSADIPDDLPQAGRNFFAELRYQF